MKLLVGAACLAVLMCGVPAYAETQQERCAIIGELASAIMEARQAGAVMSVVMAAMSDENPIAPLAKILVRQAYDTPRYQTESVQKDAIIDFRNDTESLCYSSDL